MAADTFACISQYVALATATCLPTVSWAGASPFGPTATRRRARPRWRSHQRRARRCRPQRGRLATMRTGANYSLWMVGRQARHGGPTCVQNIPERGWGPWQEALRGRTTPIAALSERDDA